MTAKSDTDMHVSFEDQQKINKFARHNARLDDIVEELKSKENELQALEDAESDLMLSEDKDKVPFRIGDVFVFVSVDDAQQMIEEKKENVSLDAKALRDQQAAVKQMITRIKFIFNSKFH
ncbi:prefoldin subunit 4 [Nephila pilipes]|uniref:Prefoldin subunit 4 n=1 Tax=Nephila pilipes TaxID=299642 RepID=A0A8X6TDM0_NEPPI|nr:prefoldin subunit 4 [Nephila pilipes]